MAFHLEIVEYCAYKNGELPFRHKSFSHFLFCLIFTVNFENQISCFWFFLLLCFPYVLLSLLLVHSLWSICTAHWSQKYLTTVKHLHFETPALKWKKIWSLNFGVGRWEILFYGHSFSCLVTLYSLALECWVLI